MKKTTKKHHPDTRLGYIVRKILIFTQFYDTIKKADGGCASVSMRKEDIFMKSINDLPRFSKEWWKNLYFYYKWHILIGVIALVLIFGTVFSQLTRVEPDIYILFSGDYVLTEEDHNLLKARIEPVISDINQDNKKEVKLIEIPLRLNSEHADETTPASNLQMQMQFATGEQHILVLDRTLFELYNSQGLLDTETLLVSTKECSLFEGTTLEERDALMVTRVKRHDYESDFTTSRELIDYWKDK